MANEASNYIRVTEAARRKRSELEAAGYLHSNYSRFKDITDYDSVLYKDRLDKIGNTIISKQIAREQQIYKELGINGIQELREKFLGDEGLQDFIGSSFNNVYTTIADALKEVAGESSLERKINKKTKKEMEQSMQNAFDRELDKLSEEYKNNLNKMTNKGALSKEMIDSFRKVNNRTDNNKMKTAAQIARSSLGHWKGELLEQCLGMFISQLSKVKGVEITGSNLDEFGKFIKSDVTAFTDNMTIGLSAKNYQIDKTDKSNLRLKQDLILHGGGSFASFLNRIESLKGEDLTQYTQNIAQSFRTNNYYYNLINEAARKTTFKSSKPATDFIETVKGLAAAWFGTQLVTNTQEKIEGQNVDFLVVSNVGFIPMSSLLIALREQTANLKVNLSSKGNIDEESIYRQKVTSPYTTEGLYSKKVQQIGFYAGQEIYSGIRVGAIKLNLILQQLI